MPGNTARGLPYPLPTEPVAEGAQAIRNLAEALDPKYWTLPAPSATPPASPVAGQLWAFPADAANGIVWLFAYEPSEATYKWRFVGGAPLVATATSGITLAPSAWNMISPPDILLPRTGEYNVRGTMRIGVATANQQCYAAIANASVAASPIGQQTAVVVANYDTAVVDTPTSG